MRIKELPGKGIAVSTDCNSRYCYLDPYQGGMAAVFEAARNCVCVGALPVAITNCLNFGNPYDPEVFYQFKEVIRGMKDACLALDTPVTGGNVSFHNESQSFAIYPTPTIGMLGLIDDLNKILSPNLKNEGDYIFLIGNNRKEIGGSELVKLLLGKVTGKAPIVSTSEEIILQKSVLDFICKSMINSAHDLAEGGLAIALAEMCTEELGLDVYLGQNPSLAELFGESQSRIIVTVTPENHDKFVEHCSNIDLPYFTLGRAKKGTFEIHNAFKMDLKEIKDIYNNALEKAVH
jgi:phosphoribosylformylglycinamidine synthase